MTDKEETDAKSNAMNLPNDEARDLSFSKANNAKVLRMFTRQH